MAGEILKAGNVLKIGQRVEFYLENEFGLKYICSSKAGVAQLVERQPSKLNVAGSNPVSRSKPHRKMGLFFMA